MKNGSKITTLPCISYNNNLALNSSEFKPGFNPNKINLNLALNPSIQIATSQTNNLLDSDAISRLRGISKTEDESYEIAGCPQSVIDEFKNYKSNYDGINTLKAHETILGWGATKNVFQKTSISF